MEERMNTVRQQDALEHYDDKPATKREKEIGRASCRERV